MNTPVLADSSALIALFRRDDQHHDAAERALTALQEAGRKLILTTDIFSEVVTAVRRRMGYDKAVFVGETLRTTGLLRMVGVDDSVRGLAWTRFKALRIPHLSLTDCTSFETMDRLGIREAFTFDADFKKAGYRIVPAQG